MENTRFKISQYACAVLLIVSSIALVAYQVVEIDDVASGLLYYVAQSFLLAGSIFGPNCDKSKLPQRGDLVVIGRTCEYRRSQLRVKN